jgi:hypothetical protein
MNYFRSLLLGLVMATLANTAYAAQVNRAMSNTDTTDLYFLTQSAMPTGVPNRQMFRNNLDFAKSLWVQIGGNMSFIPETTITVKLYDGCGTLVNQTSKVADNSGLTTPSS